MNTLVLAWEFPPRIVGGISRHVSELYPELVKLGHGVHLVTVEVEQSPSYELVEGVHVYRVPVLPSPNFYEWVDHMNQAMETYASNLIAEGLVFDLIHAHDWLVSGAAISLKHRFKLPIVATIHATESGRHNGIHTSEQRRVHDREASLAYNAWRVIVCTEYMQQEINRVFQLPTDKIDVIYNGIRPEKKQLTFDTHAFREQFATDDEKIVYYVGRMTYEKGLSVFLRAMPHIIATMEAKVRFILIGSGEMEYLKRQAWELDIAPYCRFTGFMPDSELDRFQQIADCAVFPSLYEPFGIVALESFAARVPVVVSNTGGFPEVVQNEITGVVTQVNDAYSLAEGILSVLKNPIYAQHLTEHAYLDLQKRFSWPQLGQQTLKVYTQVLEERKRGSW
jgi:glycosyltransferase involved in cell wall biosynthesis